MGLRRWANVGDRLDVIDLTTRKVIASIEFGRRCVDADCMPGYTLEHTVANGPRISEIDLTQPAEFD